MNEDDIQKLRDWFLVEQRDLPWRSNPSAYAVWVSEVMLQQTQVSVVIPYFQRWMQQFPTIESLAQASQDEVVKTWEGLGYYSRARNLHAGARQIVAEFGGALPQTELELSRIKGLGPYTIGAILSFAFRQRAAAVDGNVLRVMARHGLIEDDISKPRTVSVIRQKVQDFLPENESWVISEGLIELGAVICSKRPRCMLCPLKSSCKALMQGKVESLPYKSAKVKSTVLYREVAVIISGGQCLVRCGEKGQVMEGLYEFPYFDVESELLKLARLKGSVQQQLGLDIGKAKKLSAVRHGFTRYDVRLMPALFECVVRKDVPGYKWMAKEELERVPFSSGHRRIYQELTCKFL